MPHLDRRGGGQFEQPLRAAVARHEHPHHIVVGGVALEPGRAQLLDEHLRSTSGLDAQFEHPPAWLLQPLDGTVRHDAALVHDDDVAAGVFDVGKQVRGDDDVDALVEGEVADELEHLVAPLRVHAVGRLVEEQEVGVVHERLRQLDALLHARGVGFDVAVARLAQPDVEQHLVRALHRVDPGQPRQFGAVGDEADGVHPRNVGVVLRHVADARPDLERGVRHVEPQHPHAPLVRDDEAEQRLDHRALARPVGAEQPDRAGAERRRDVAQRRIRAVGDRHAFQRDDRTGLSHRWSVIRVRRLRGFREVRAPRPARA